MALGEVLGFDSEDAVEPGAGVFPRDYGGEFDQLSLRKILAKCGIEVVGNVTRNAGERDGEEENGFLNFAEMRTGFELREILQLLLGDALFSAHGRVNVDSKGTADHEGDFELREFFEVHGDGALRGGVHVETRGVAEEFRVESANAQAGNVAAERTFSEKHEDPAEERRVQIALAARHGGWM